MKKFIYFFLLLQVGDLFSLDTNVVNLAQLIVDSYTNSGSMHVYVYSSTNKHLGLGNCDFLRNGEDGVVKNFIKSGHVVIDAGAHVGGWTKSVLDAVQEKCHIYAFEPVPDSYNTLLKIQDDFPHNVFAYNFALGKEESNLEMNYFFERGSDCSSIFNRPVLHDVPVQKITVKMISIDKFVQEHGIDRVDFLKIDTEGAEWDVLLGAKNLIESNSVDIIQFEYGGTYPDAGITLFQVYNYLTSNNYLIFRIMPNGLIYIPEWDNSLENFEYSNYLALKK